MTRPAQARAARAVLAAALVVAVSAAPAAAESQSGQDPPRRDEFGLIPEDATDKDLLLPDPILDRNWPGPRPGLGDAHPGYIAPDEESLDPFAIEEEAPAAAPPPPAEDEDPGEEAPRRPLVGTDGKPDVGSPVPEADPGVPDALEPDVMERDEMEEEENRPSPLDLDDEYFNEEMGDPGEW